MKIKNQPPIRFMSGTPRPWNEENYYVWRTIQVRRRYYAPSAPYNASYNLSRDYQYAAKLAWLAMPGADKRAWGDFSEEWRRSISGAASKFSGWICFAVVQHYRQLAGVSISSTPPPVLAPRSASIYYISKYINPPGGSLFYYRVHNLQAPGFKLCVHRTTPKSGYLHAYRKSERKLIAGMSSGSLIDIPLQGGNDNFFVDYNPTLYAMDKYLWIETRLLSPDFFPMEVHREQIKIGDTISMLSSGVISQAYNPGSLPGVSIPDTVGDAAWSLPVDKSSGSLETYSTNAYYRFPIPYNPGSKLETLTVRWSGAIGVSQIVIKFFRRDIFFPGDSDTLLFTLTDTSSELIDDAGINLGGLTLADGYAYWCEIKSINPDYSQILLHGIIIQTSLRAY